MKGDEKGFHGPIEIAEGIYWVGFFDINRNLHCNPYLIVDGKEALLIDGGSRTDFSIVMMKVLQAGIVPDNIKNLLYHHYDPDLCGSIPNFEDLIDRKDLKIISHRENNVFIRYYSVRSVMHCVESMGWEMSMENGRKITFIHTPYAHSPGSFMTFDSKTGTLFSSDIFGSYHKNWSLFLDLDNECYNCMPNEEKCQTGRGNCPVLGIENFHQKIMTSGKALNYALSRIKSLPVKRIAPQHGSIITKEEDIAFVKGKLAMLEGVGIDKVQFKENEDEII